MMSIVKELTSAKKTSLDATNDIVKDVKLLLDTDGSEDLRIANALGQHHSLALAQKKIGMQIELEQLDVKYAGNVFKINDIKKLCIKYHMRFLQSKHFTGHLDVTALHKIKEFAKETNTAITDGNLQSNFFILAPDESFSLKANRLPKKSDDPAIFYRIDQEHYRLIHKWGVDFTIARMWKGFLFKSETSRWVTKTIGWSALLMTATLLMSYAFNYSGWVSIFVILPSPWLALFDRYIKDTVSSSRYKLFTPHTWDKAERNY